jgi:hypothetical protein
MRSSSNKCGGIKYEIRKSDEITGMELFFGEHCMQVMMLNGRRAVR